MGDKQDALARIERELEKTFPSGARDDKAQSLVNDIEAVAKCGALTAAQLRLVERMIGSIKTLLKNSN